jgi:hypothetical protein
MNVGEEECIQAIGGKAHRKDTTRYDKGGWIILRQMLEIGWGVWTGLI